MVVDRSNKFMYPLPTKDSLGVAWKLLDLMLDHGSVNPPRSPRDVERIRRGGSNKWFRPE